MDKIKGIKLKSARISFLPNYFLAVFILCVIFLTYPLLDIPSNNFHTLLIFSGIVYASILVQEPEIRRLMRTYFITNNEAIKIEGIIRKNKISIPYQNVTSVSFYKGVLGRIFNFGDVVVKSGSGEIRILGIKDPEQITRIIENKISLTKREGKK